MSDSVERELDLREGKLFSGRAIGGNAYNLVDRNFHFLHENPKMAISWVLADHMIDIIHE